MNEVVCWLLGAYHVVLLMYIVFSLVPRPPQPIRPVNQGVNAIVDPLVIPLRRVLPPVQLGRLGGLDLSILVLFIAVSLLQQAFCGGSLIF